MAETKSPEEPLGIHPGKAASAEGTAEPAERPGRSRWLAFAMLGLLLLLFAAIRWRLRDLPLERDEGEYAYAGQLILQGIPPYELAYNMKLPGTYLAYAAILRSFGETVAGIHLGLLLVNGCTTVLMFFLARRLYGDLAGATAAASFALFSTSESALGLRGHATHFVVLMAVAGLLLLLAARESRSLWTYFAVGLCMGLAFLMKQPGMMFVLFGVQEIAWRGWKESSRGKRLAARLSAYGAGALLPYLVTCVTLYRAGVFAKFWFWTISYASQYGTSTGIAEGMHNLWGVLPRLFFSAPVVWYLAALGIFAEIYECRKGATPGFSIGLLLWSFAGVSAGLYYRPHYFILLFPAVCLLVGEAMQWSTDQLEGRTRWRKLSTVPVLSFVLGFGLALYAQRAVFFELSPTNLVRLEYAGSPYPEAIEFGEYIKQHSKADAKVAVLDRSRKFCFTPTDIPRPDISIPTG